LGDEGTDFRVHADWLFEGIIRPVMATFPEFNVPIRADKIARPGMIDTQVIEQLLSVDLVIADLSFLNPNAFYEIGIRHVAERPIVHMQLKHESLPFDVGGFRSIKFSLRHPSEVELAKTELQRAVQEVSAKAYRVETPVTHARGRIKIEESATPSDRLLLEEVRSLRSRVNQIEQRAESSGPERSLLSDAAVVTRAQAVRHANSAFLISFDPKKISIAELSGRSVAIGERHLSGRKWNISNLPDGGIFMTDLSGKGVSSKDFSTIRSRLLAEPGVISVI
jgi:hypothetical protein